MKCEHGVYIPKADESTGKAWHCQQCYPEGHPEEAQTPVMLPRSSSDSGGSSEKKTCAKCGNLRTYFTNNCRKCGAEFPEEDLRGRSDARANRRQQGACPGCGSTIHYDTKRKSFWECADCGEEFRAPKLKEAAAE